MSFFFFFQAEDGIRDLTVTGVQTCALPISLRRAGGHPAGGGPREDDSRFAAGCSRPVGDRKSTRLNSSHSQISYAVFCLKKKKKENRENRALSAYAQVTRAVHTRPHIMCIN